MPTRSNNFVLETMRKREEDDDVADVGWMAGEEGRDSTRRHIKKFLRYEWTSDLVIAFFAKEECEGIDSSLGQ